MSAVATPRQGEPLLSLEGLRVATPSRSTR